MAINNNLQWEAQKSAFCQSIELMLKETNKESKSERIESGLPTLKSENYLENSIIFTVTFDKKRELIFAYQKLLSIFADPEVEQFFSGKLPKKTEINLRKKVSYYIPETNVTPTKLLYITKECMTHYKSNNLRQIHTPYGSVIEVKTETLNSEKKSTPYENPFAKN